MTLSGGSSNQCMSVRCFSPWGFCAYKDGDRGLGSWHLFPGALQREHQAEPGSDGVGPSCYVVHQLSFTFLAQHRCLKSPLLTAVVGPLL